jgi:hypothetical protein
MSRFTWEIVKEYSLPGFEERFAEKIIEEKRLLRARVAEMLLRQYESTSNPRLLDLIAYFTAPLNP